MPRKPKLTDWQAMMIIVPISLWFGGWAYLGWLLDEMIVR